MVRIGLALVLTLALSLGLSRVSLTQAQETHTVVISGLNAPRGMTFGPDGKLYVAEAGTGGDEQSDWVPPFRTAKIGKTGRIVRIDDGKATEVASGLQSVALGPQAEIVGAQELAFIGDTLYAVVGQANALPGGKETFSLLVKIGADGKAETVADLGKYEKENNPDGTVPDSNPFGLAATPDGNLYVVDAGGNDLLKVTPDGEISTVIAWKDNAVPTSVAFDKSGQAYVTFLSPFPFAVGSSRLERLNGATSQVVVPALTTGVDVKVGPDGNVYVLEHTAEQLPGPPPHFKEKSGRVLRVTPSGLEAVATGLNFPTKMAFGPDGALYIANNAVGPAGSGEIIKMTLPEKGTPVTVARPAPAAAAPSPAAKPSAPAAAAAPSPAAKPAAPSQAPAAAPSPSALPRTGIGPDLAASALPVAATGAGLALAGLAMMRRRRR